MSDAAVILGDPGTRTNYRTAAMGIAFRTSMIVPAPNILKKSEVGWPQSWCSGSGGRQLHGGLTQHRLLTGPLGTLGHGQVCGEGRPPPVRLLREDGASTPRILCLRHEGR